LFVLAFCPHLFLAIRRGILPPAGLLATYNGASMFTLHSTHMHTRAEKIAAINFPFPRQNFKFDFKVIFTRENVPKM
jgi:hypothetical protein